MKLYTALTLLSIFLVSCGGLKSIDRKSPWGKEKKNLSQIEDQCKAGDAEICFALASEAYSKGMKDYAYKPAKKGCSLNNFPSCYISGSILLTKLKKVDARKDLIKACNAKISFACTLYGYSYAGEEEKIMTKYYLKGCHLKDPKGCQNYAFYSFEKQKIKTSVKYFDKSCTLKNSRSCFILSKLYEELYNNEKVSMKYAEKACQLKDNPSCLSAAVKSKMQGKLVEYEYYTQKFCENLGKGKCTNKLLRATKESIHSLSIIKKEQIKTRKKRKFNPNDLKI